MQDTTVINNEVTTESKGGISKFALQLIAFVFMVLDHLAVFVPNTLLFYVLKFFGRITIMIMCFFVAEGYYKTRNLSKYIIRMGVFALVSQIPFWLYKYLGNTSLNIYGILFSMINNRNVIFTLFVGLCLLTIFKKYENVFVKIVAFFAAAILVRNSDWGYWAVLWILGFGLFNGSKPKQLLSAAVLLLVKIILLAPAAIKSVMVVGGLTYGMLDLFVMFGGFIGIALLAGYKGTKGGGLKYGFYIGYPLQYILIVIAAYLLF